MTNCAASRAAAACGAGSVREPLMPAFACGGSAGESTRGGLPSRPPAAPAWTGYGEGGGRALGPAGLAMASARLSKSVFGVGLFRVHGRPCYPDAPRPHIGLRSGPRPRREWEWIWDRMSSRGPATGAATGLRQGYGVQLVSGAGVCVTGAGGGVSMMSVVDLALLAGGAAFGVGAGRTCRYSYGGLPPGAWRLCLRAGRWLAVGTDRRCLDVCWHGQALLCLPAPA